MSQQRKRPPQFRNALMAGENASAKRNGLNTNPSRTPDWRHIAPENRPLARPALVVFSKSAVSSRNNAPAAQVAAAYATTATRT